MDKLKNRDKQTIERFLKLSPDYQDDNIRSAVVDAIAIEEVPAELQDRLIKITNAKDYTEAISYIGLPADEKAFVTEVYATCNNYYINGANFSLVAGYLNGKITSLLNKGKDMTARDHQLAGMLTIFKHSYYYWNNTKIE